MGVRWVVLGAAVLGAHPVAAGNLNLGDEIDRSLAELRERFGKVSEVEGQRDGRRLFYAFDPQVKQSMTVWFCNDRLDEKSQPFEGGFPAFVKLIVERERRFGPAKHFPEVDQTPVGESTRLRLAWHDESTAKVHYVDFAEFMDGQTLSVGERALPAICE